MEKEIYEELRPYSNDEIPAAMSRIASNGYFDHIAQYLFPSVNPYFLKQTITSISSIHEFQDKIMYPAIESITKKSINRFTFEGLEHIDQSKGSLFIGNHRDIVLDSMLLCKILHSNKITTPQITFGSNLMQGELLIDIGKSNKMFKVKRGGTPREFYSNSLHLSQYIRETVVCNNQSVWIAQRNGRTKNGIDKTEPGLLRMFCMSGEKNLTASIAQLNIIPVSTSYQFETCDLLKARELHLSKNTQYIKAPGEDLNSILTGINEYKGNVHIAFGKPISADDINNLNAQPNEIITAVAKLIDQRIYSNYRLWNTNWIALSILENNLYADKFTEEEYINFIDRMDQKLNQYSDLAVHLKPEFLEIYANPTKYCK